MTNTQPVNESLSAWDRVQIARNAQRPHTLDYIGRLFEQFVELHGDRRFGDDPALVAGMGMFAGRPVMVMGHQKGSNTRENVQRNFGMPKPEGYRKALRLFSQAEKFGMPLVCFIDTPAADPGKESEERGQANAIAECILAMCGLRTPIIAVVIGEGGSGGALAISVADRILMLEHAVYSVVSPEGCASILWRDASKAPEAARAMRITARDVHAFGVADVVVDEPEGGAHADAEAAIGLVGDALRETLGQLADLEIDTLLARRYDKYRAIGYFQEHQQALLSAAESATTPLPFT